MIPIIPILIIAGSIAAIALARNFDRIVRWDRRRIERMKFVHRHRYGIGVTPLILAWMALPFFLPSYVILIGVGTLAVFTAVFTIRALSFWSYSGNRHKYAHIEWRTPRGKEFDPYGRRH